MRISDWSSDVCSSDLPAQITCNGYTGLHPSGQVRSFVIPFADEYSDGGVFGSNADDHAIAHSSMAEINDSPALQTSHSGAYDRKSVGQGQSVAVGVERGGSRIIPKRKRVIKKIIRRHNS